MICCFHLENSWDTIFARTCAAHCGNSAVLVIIMKILINHNYNYNNRIVIIIIIIIIIVTIISIINIALSRIICLTIFLSARICLCTDIYQSIQLSISLSILEYCIHYLSKMHSFCFRENVPYVVNAFADSIVNQQLVLNSHDSKIFFWLVICDLRHSYISAYFTAVICSIAVVIINAGFQRSGRH